MRYWIAAACLLLSSTTSWADAPPAPLWTASGFRTPESALYAAPEKAIFVSNIDGDPGVKDGKGFISRLDTDGKIVQLEWVSGLNAPKGMGYAQGRLFVADIGEVVEIDVKSAQIVKRYPAPGSKFLNDVALEPRSNFKGQVARVYISDFSDNAIWYLGDHKLSKLVMDPALETPNGLLVEGEQLRIASWGVLGGDGLKTPVPGRIKTMALDSEGIGDRFTAMPLGNLDGIEADGKGGYWVSDWLAGKIIHVDAAGQSSTWLQLEQGTADIGIIPGKLLLVPMMMQGELRAYALPK
jgi:hypothetical protein